MKMVGDSPKRTMSSCFEIAMKMMNAPGLVGAEHSVAFKAVLAAVDLSAEEAARDPHAIIKGRLMQLVESGSACLALTILIKAGSAAMQLESDRREAAGNN